MSYTGQDLDDIRAKYNLIWKQIKTIYPKASGSIHFAYSGDFAPVNDSFGNLIRKNHSLFLDFEAKKKVQNLIKTVKDASEDDIKKILLKAPLNPDCRIEVIWSELDYDLIRQLQTDPLIDSALTPISRASIRIVLGVVGSRP